MESVYGTLKLTLKWDFKISRMNIWNELIFAVAHSRKLKVVYDFWVGVVI